MINRQFILLVALLAAGLSGASAMTENAIAEYWPVALRRAGKIVEGMAVEDPAVRAALQEVIAGQYRDLFILYGKRDEALAQVKANDFGFPLFEENAIDGIEEGTRRAVEQLHRQFVARLGSLTDADGVEAVKDGMTYNVAPNTLRVYRDMFPDLPAEQMAQVKAWLWEAREYAMDGGSSDEKHKWFGKYKGRINNYLSGLGYDLKQAERDMFARKKLEQQGND